jgi:hypothetical protein
MIKRGAAIGREGAGYGFARPARCLTHMPVHSPSNSAVDK